MVCDNWYLCSGLPALGSNASHFPPPAIAAESLGCFRSVRWYNGPSPRRPAMNTRGSCLALVLLIFGVLAANASAATVTFTLDLTGPPGTFNLTASDSIGDNGGITSLRSAVGGPVYTSVSHLTVCGIVKKLCTAGFSEFRSPDGEPTITARQSLQYLQNPITGFGQTGGDFLSKTGSVHGGQCHSTFNCAPWTAPLLIADGYYDAAIGIPSFAPDANLFQATVYTLDDTSTRIPAQVVTRVLLIPEPATCALVVAAISMLSVRRK